MRSVYAVIGYPIGHTMSPFIHRRLFALSGRDVDYQTVEIVPENLNAELPRLMRGAEGVNVTIPHKQAVIPLLSRLEGAAARYQTVNCIAVRGNEAVGYNTDADGAVLALRDAGRKLSGDVALIGAGGAAKALACEMALAGCRITNAVRDADVEAGKQLGQLARQLAPGTSYHVVTLDQLEAETSRFDLLFNATPVGMHPHPGVSPVTENTVSRCSFIFDLVYNPGETHLLQLAKGRGVPGLGGMPMLVWQAAAAHKIWYGGAFAPADVWQIIKDAQAEMGNHSS